MTGWPIDLLTQGIQQLMEPDEHSRTPDHDGRRLVLIDPARSWGWIAVNHGKYREKARLMAKDSDRTASGRDAERKRAERAAPSPDVPRSPTASPGLPLSDSDADTDENLKNPPVAPPLAAAGRSETTDGTRSRQTGHRLPEDFALSAERRRVAQAEHVDPERTFAKFCDYWRAASGSSARKRDWDAAWRNWCRSEADRGRGTAPRPKPPPPTRAERERVEREGWDREKARARKLGFRAPLTGEALENFTAAIDREIGDRENARRYGTQPTPAADLLPRRPP
jgi:hypothetical protein